MKKVELIEDGRLYRNGLLQDSETLIYNKEITHEEIMCFLAGYSAKSNYNIEYSMFERILSLPLNGNRLKYRLLGKKVELQEVKKFKPAAKKEAYKSIW